MLTDDLFNRFAKCLLPALALIVITAVAFRLFSRREEAVTDGTSTTAVPGKPNAPEKPFVIPHSAAREVLVGNAPRTPTVRVASSETSPASIEIPDVAASVPANPDAGRLDAPHAPTVPPYRLTYGGGDKKLTAEEQARAVSTASVVNLTASLKLALLKGDKTAAREIVDRLRVYGDLAEKGLEVEEANAKNLSLAAAFRRIREQIK